MRRGTGAVVIPDTLAASSERDQQDGGAAHSPTAAAEPPTPAAPSVGSGRVHRAGPSPTQPLRGRPPCRFGPALAQAVVVATSERPVGCVGLSPSPRPSPQTPPCPIARAHARPSGRARRATAAASRRVMPLYPKMEVRSFAAASLYFCQRSLQIASGLMPPCFGSTPEVVWRGVGWRRWRWRRWGGGGGGGLVER